MSEKYLNRITHDSGMTEVFSGSRVNYWNFWQEHRHSIYPLWTPAAGDEIYNKNSFCHHIKYPHYAFEFVIEGELEVRKGENTLLLKPGEATFLISGEDSTLRAGKAGYCRKASCTFTGELVHAIFSALQLTDSGKITPENPEKILMLIQQISELLGRQETETEPEICGLGYQLLNHISLSVPHGESYLFERAKRLLTLSVPQKREIRDIAQQLGTNINTLERLFREQLGVSPREYLTGLRMQVAAELLRSASVRIGHIAERVGYNDPLAFSHAFKRFHGVSPRQFRETALQSKISENKKN